MVNNNYCQSSIVFHWVLGLPENPAPFNIYFVKTENSVEMYEVNKDGIATLINPSIATLAHNLLSGLQGGQAGQYYHLTLSQYNSLVGLIAGAITSVTGNLVDNTDPANPVINGDLQKILDNGGVAMLTHTGPSDSSFLVISTSTITSLVSGIVVGDITSIVGGGNSLTISDTRAQFSSTVTGNPAILLDEFITYNQFLTERSSSVPWRIAKGYQWILGTKVGNSDEFDQIGDYFAGTFNIAADPIANPPYYYPCLRWNGGPKDELTSYTGTEYFYFLPFPTDPDFE